ncbi:tetratricopeptide repeat protein [Mucilaginibacter yixingensis]|uniref:Tetratricopeptide repeat protein n=1 Tax=Mucilaginibacter yixingensis TaxID=1295612 RepID=A0A2T5JDL2_9SPHI|nr:tetratricopeptide repeat protein [Mucilaginibacter yixingensis]PTQ99858.1 tetratricopeptide repeat protein [Mucilaginibacter yixingensis]
MKNLNLKTTLLVAFICICMAAPTLAQSTDAKALVKQGTELHDQGKYNEALAKYTEAMKADPNYPTAYYEYAYTLFTTGKGKDAITYLEKLLKLDPKSANAYDMLGSIYDDMGQQDQAIEYYKKGVAANPDYQRLHFNLSITYYRKQLYSQSAQEALAAIKLDPKHASSHRIYGMAAYALNQRGAALLAFCNFLLLEPQSKRSLEIVNNVKKIINYGIKRKDAKNVTLSVSPDDMGNLMMSMSVLAATDKKGELSAVDSLQYQLTSLFNVANTIAGGDKADPFVVKYYGDYFKALAETDNMPAFTRFISVSLYPTENMQWLKDHDKELTAFDIWTRSTLHKF